MKRKDLREKKCDKMCLFLCFGVFIIFFLVFYLGELVFNILFLVEIYRESFLIWFTIIVGFLGLSLVII